MSKLSFILTNHFKNIFIELYQLFIGISLLYCYVSSLLSASVLLTLYMIWFTGIFVYIFITYNLLTHVTNRNIKTKEKEWILYNRSKFVCFFCTYTIILIIEFMKV